ncbi:MAG: single-stranded-DNA-specific exonuclease RecJ [bacterium]
MLNPRFNWRIENPDDGAVRTIMSELGLSEPVAKVLANRGLDTPEKAKAFLEPSLDNLHDPLLLDGMDRAVDRMIRALEGNERILVVGDYDVDGVTGATLLVDFLRKREARVMYHIPDRESEGYGLSVEVVHKARDAGYSLLAIVDSGTTAFEAIAEAKSVGIECIVLDHHEPGDSLPEAVAVVNPKLNGSSYPFRDLAAVGVVFKFLQALSGRLGGGDEWVEKAMELVALGTVADLMPLLDENRAFVIHGLSKMHESVSPGLSALLKVAGISREREVSAQQVSFGLAPRINAAGRVWKPNAGVDMLLTDDPDRALALAAKLDEKNRERMREESWMLESALEMIKGQFDPAADKSVVLFNEKWLVGVVGIVAARILDRYYRPVILFTASKKPQDVELAGEGRGHVCAGSARSINGVDIHRALERASDLLITFGGHSMAAGVRIFENDIPKFRERLNEIVGEMYEGDFTPTLRVDTELRLKDVSMDLLDRIKVLEPCGVGNPRPVFYTSGVTVLETRQCGGGGKHLKMNVGQGSVMMDAIGFGLGERWPVSELAGEAVDVAFVLREDYFRGRRSVALQIRDIRSAG